MVELAQTLAGHWLTIWVAGLVLSYRMIIPAEKFLSARSAEWLSAALTQFRGTGARRRFGVAFKRYVDQTFGARQIRFGRCRFWTFSLGRSILVSFLTFQVIYWMIIWQIELGPLSAGYMEDLREMADPNHPGYRPQLAPLVELVERLDPDFMLYGMLAVNSLLYGLANTLTDYFSFVETRNILARLGRGTMRDMMLVALDIVLTTAIALLGFAAMAVAILQAGALLGDTGMPMEVAAVGGFNLAAEALQNAVLLIAGRTPVIGATEPATMAMVLSTYATSIWIWVFFAGAILIRAVALAGPLFHLVGFLVDVESHPFRAAWLMFAFVYTIGLLLAALV